MKDKLFLGPHLVLDLFRALWHGRSNSVGMAWILFICNDPPGRLQVDLSLRAGRLCTSLLPHLFAVLEGYELARGPRGIRTSGDSVEEVEKNFELPAALFSLPPTSPEKIERPLTDNCVGHLSIL